MRQFIIAALITCGVIAAVAFTLSATQPCTPASIHGAKIGSAMLIAGCR